MSNNSRSKKAIINVLASFLNEFVTIICGLILPRLILSTFGSAYNGITSSITQFISCIVLMKSGIGGVTRAALFKPLADNNTNEISKILSQTEKFLRKIAIAFLFFILVFSFIYPTFICKDFGFLFSSSLVIIISLSTFFQYYFGLTNQILLMADQKNDIIAYINIITVILNTIVSAILIKLGFGIHLVKLGSAIIFILNPIVLNYYVKKKYKIKKIITHDNNLISQRWDALGQEIANFINTNTDVMILTIFTNMKEISVYTVYNFVANGIRTMVTNFVNGFTAAFGNMYAKKEYDLMKKNLGICEMIIFSVSTVAYGTMLVMIVPFALLYTAGVTDVNYARPSFGILITIAGAFNCFKIPYQVIVNAIGHYKQTRNGAFLEAFINIVLSIFGVIKFGLIGVMFGTIVAAIFRTTQYAIYISKKVLNRNIVIYFKHVILSLTLIFFVFFISHYYIVNVNNVILWILKSVITFSILMILTFITNFIFYRDDTKLFISKIKKNFNIRRKSND